MGNELSVDKQYRQWLTEIKQRILSTQLKAATAVNTALLEFYWNLGADIVQKQEQTIWGSGFLKQLSMDLMAEFPDMKGFSKRNLEHIKRWYLFYSQANTIAKQAASQFPQHTISIITQIPW